MMFKSIKLKNVLSHVNSSLNFHPGVNMIIGPSDHGKSAIFNAFYKVISNRPSGDEWRAWGSDVSEIELELEDGWIKYIKENQAEYRIGPPGAGPRNFRTFKAFGQSIPEEIQTWLNMDQKINVQRQLERGVPIFLIAESPGDVAKHFNSVAGFDLIDASRAAGKKDVKNTENALKGKKDTLQKKKDELKGYEFIPDFEALVNQAERENKTKDEWTAQMEKVALGLEGIKALENRLKILQQKLSVYPFIKSAIELYNKIKDQKQQVENIQGMMEMIEGLKKQITQMNGKLSLQGLVDRAFTFFNIQNQYKDQIRNIQERKKGIEILLKDLNDCRENYRKAKANFNKIMPKDICPVCKGVLK